MNEQEIRDLCVALVRADTEEEVVRLIKDAGYWDLDGAWRYYGDYELNYNTIGNQQSRPDAALVEKLVNSVDARLMNECLVRNLNPESEDAPQGIQEAVARFFGDSDRTANTLAGQIRDWTERKRTEIARGITLVATGGKPGNGNLCFTIADMGEGQTPNRMPDTLLSLNKSNKLRIPFVQGKFNMGGTGVLKFCGKRNIQLILSRRNPAIINDPGKNPDDRKWGFTVVRREDPRGNLRSSVYTYLAPFEARHNPNHGGVLRFSADGFPLFPEGNNPYGHIAKWGTLIKLYEYSATGFKSHILMKDGLLGRIDLLLPEIALPMRFHECRDYKGHEGSFETTLTGIRVRLEDDKGQNLEENFPASAPMRVAGEEMFVSVYAFKKRRSEAYRKNEGIIFVVNGQTHGHLTQDFFSRKRVGLSYLADSILVIVDCTRLSGRAREDLFMNSRDRLSGGELRQLIEESLEELLKHHEGLRALKERRRREEIEAKLDDAKPLEDILENLLKNSPALSSLFLKGIRASTPFKTVGVQTQDQPFRGKRFPTHFKIKGKPYGYVLNRDCHIDNRCRIAFETDAENEYLSRPTDHGAFGLFLTRNGDEYPVQTYVLNLQNGIASLSLELPNDAKVGDELTYISYVSDCSRMEPFTNVMILSVKEHQEPQGHGEGRRKPPNKEKGNEREVPSGIKLPYIVLIEEGDWKAQTPPFDKFTGMRIRHAGVSNGESGAEEDETAYDFFVNMGNLYLQSELKATKSETELLRAQFKYGMVLLGLALIQQETQEKNQEVDEKDNMKDVDDNGGSIETRVEKVCRALAPVILPIIESLGSLSVEDGMVVGASGEAT